jgi:RNA polymerase sigma-70 factor, ECF subfamily
MEDVRRQIVDLLPRLRRFGRSLTGDRDRGDDLVQETCVRALSRLDQWERGTRLDSWLYRIAQNIWLDQRRAAKVRGELLDIDEAVEVSGEDGRIITDVRLELADVERALGNLPDDQRIAIGLVCIQGLSYAQAAEITEVPVGTMMSRLSRGRRALFEAVGGRERQTPSEEQSGA